MTGPGRPRNRSGGYKAEIELLQGGERAGRATRPTSPRDHNSILKIRMTIQRGARPAPEDWGGQTPLSSWTSNSKSSRGSTSHRRQSVIDLGIQLAGLEENKGAHASTCSRRAAALIDRPRRRFWTRCGLLTPGPGGTYGGAVQQSRATNKVFATRGRAAKTN